jgi:hypothetical protein
MNTTTTWIVLWTIFYLGVFAVALRLVGYTIESIIKMYFGAKMAADLGAQQLANQELTAKVLTKLNLAGKD